MAVFSGGFSAETSALDGSFFNRSRIRGGIPVVRCFPDMAEFRIILCYKFSSPCHFLFRIMERKDISYSHTYRLDAGYRNAGRVPIGTPFRRIGPVSKQHELSRYLRRTEQIIVFPFYKAVSAHRGENASWGVRCRPYRFIVRQRFNCNNHYLGVVSSNCTGC